MAQAHRLLVVDDEPDLRALYELTLLKVGYQVDSAADLNEARQCLASQSYDLLITDMRLPDGLGLELVRQVTAEQRPEKTIVITAYGSAENAVTALKAGAFDYLTKPVELPQLRQAVATALEASPAHQTITSTTNRVTREFSSLKDTVPSTAHRGSAALSDIVGRSTIMASVRQRVEKVARSMAPVLVLGESGTGKELVAKALHACSHRANGPFVAVNCGAIPESLIEAEFFGVRKGAYTGATHDRDGYFQAAQGGTLFLDEIGDLPLLMQAKLLRAIQERKVRPLGSTTEELVDVRFVSATHRDLALAVKTGQFRQDLFYRLNVIELRVPPLRERREDLPELTQALLFKLCSESGQRMPAITDDALGWLMQQPLSGNVRELENLLHRGLALCDGDWMRPEDMEEPTTGLGTLAPEDPQPSTNTPEYGKEQAPPNQFNMVEYLDRKEREVLQRALAENNGNVDMAATALKLTPRQLRFRLDRLGISHRRETSETK